jgi:peptidyl-prolyl cis-trans isomerase B (cyclophilin B)
VASVRDRRATARAKLEREIAARQEAAARKRGQRNRIAAIAGSAVAVLIIVWVVVAVTSGGKPAANAAGASPTGTPSPTACQWNPMIPTSMTPKPTLPPEIKELGTPSPNVPRHGWQIMTINTNLGVIKISMDLSKTPCTAGSMSYLASKKYFDNSKCHRLVADISALQCGDPTYTGKGGPSYRFDDENLPTHNLPMYHDGDVAMANGGANTNGSQFFFLYNTIEDSQSGFQPSYSLFGHVIEGLDIVKKVAAGGDDEAFASNAGGGHPKTPLIFKTVTVGPVLETEPTPAATTPAPTTAAATPSATPTAKAS